MKRHPKNYKLNLGLDAGARAELEAMRKNANKTSLVDVIRAAIAVYKLIIDHQLAGGKIVLRDAQNNEETLRIV